MARVVFDHVSKRYDRAAQPTFRDLSLTVRDRELIVLVGPSGCGKSTALRLIAGLEPISSGSLFIGERRVNDLSPKDRDVAMVFQTCELDPHMTVYDHMAFPLDVRGVDAVEVRRRVLEAARVLDVEHLLERRPAELSGGQRQRVAIGRAIVRHPRVFLMDEPLSNLEAKLRASMRTEVKRVHRETHATTVYVTHDQTEAMALGDRIAVLRGGELLQVDRPEIVYARPANAFVATFIGSPEMNLLPGELVVEDGATSAVGPGFRITMPAGAPREAGPVLVGARPEHVRLVGSAHAGSKDADRRLVMTLSGIVEVVEPNGTDWFAHVSTKAGHLVCKVDPGARPDVRKPVTARIPAEHVHVFDRKTELRIA